MSLVRHRNDFFCCRVFVFGNLTADVLVQVMKQKTKKKKMERMKMTMRMKALKSMSMMN